MTERNIIETVDLTIKYTGAESPVISKLNFQAKSGQFVLVTGPSGGGKSSFLYSINGIIPFLTNAEISGDVLLNGESILSIPPAKRARTLGSVLQNPDDQIIFSRIDDEVAFPLENLEVETHKMQERIDAAINMMQLSPDGNPSVLSGGEKQKLITATTLAMKQKVLLFDEPLANLDYVGAKRLLNTLKTLCVNEGYTVLFVEHRLDWVLEYADSILWIDNGKHEFFSNRAKFAAFWDAKIESDLAYSWTDNTNPTSRDVILKAENLYYNVKGTDILRGIDFTMKRGERWVLIGDNGSGKTSFINLLSGLQKPSKGSVHCSYRKKEKYKKIGVIMQNPNYQLFMPSVRQEIEYNATSPQRVNELIEALELQGLEDRHPHSLSEGQKRKVGVAAILAMDPEVLLFDEPTVGQDYRSLALIIRELDRMNQKKPLTMLTITHDTRCASYLGDHVLWMENGTVRETGSINLLEKYQNREMSY